MEQRPSGSRIRLTVFYVSLTVVLAFVAWGVLFTDNVATVTGDVLFCVITDFGWVFILSTLSFLVFMLDLAFSRYGGIRLGGDDEPPEFRTVAWISGWTDLPRTGGPGVENLGTVRNFSSLRGPVKQKGSPRRTGGLVTP